MRIGIISDIHSNIDALNPILEKFDRLEVDKIICCGDIIGVGINPEEVIQELIKRKEKMICVLGNHENYLLKGLPTTAHDDNRKLSIEESENHIWNQKKLSEESKKFISSLEISKNIELANKKIYIIHYPINKNGAYKKIIKYPNIEDNKEMFAEIDADIFLYGHTHTYSVNQTDNKWYINPGSLGCPNGSNIAKAGILEINDNKVVEYDVKKIIKKINELKIPFYEKILKIFYE